jgi:molecular chaperone DnaK
VNPDEVVAVGAAVQGAIIAGDVKDVVLLDVTPLSLGIETEGGVMTVLVERNTTIPTEKKEIFSTAADNQTAVTVKVFQGERKMANDNRLLGQFNLEGIPPAPRGVPQIQVAFSLDVNGILNVSAKEMGSGKEQKVRIEQSGGLSKDEIERMKRDADSHADEDARKRKLAEARNEAHRRIYDTEKLLKEHADKIDGSSKSAIEAAIEKVKSKSEGEDPAAIDQSVQELMQAAQALAQHMQSQGGPGGGEEGKSASQEDVIDAEFEKKD